MGVPKFFRWLSERYPLINQPIHCPPEEATQRAHGYPPSSSFGDGDGEPPDAGGESSSSSRFRRDHRKNTNLPHIMPEFDRLYLDMNGIIHCSSHNNSEEELEKQHDGGGGDPAPSPPTRGVPPITEEQIFQNVCYYVDRIVTDVVKPKQLVFLAIDGVAPRAKLNQQRSRRYRSGTEKEIEMHLKTLRRVQEGRGDDGGDDDDDLSKEFLIEADGGAFDGYHPRRARGSDGDDGEARGAQRFHGTIDASTASVSAAGPVVDGDGGVPGFHSNEITPGTPFLHRCSKRILSFVREKLQNDPRWKDLTIIFSGHDVPGEGEHKILEFIRHEKHKPGYDPNTSHCIFGQDGDLVMLGLAMHEPHACLLREEVVFDPARKRVIEKLIKLENEKQSEDAEGVGAGEGSGDGELPPLSAAVQSYIHNANFELLHISVLREYLGLEFETQPFYPKSRYELEPTIDDFVFMTFFVGNDFLPHMPALDIGDEAFDLLFYAYKKNRGKWLNDGLYRRTVPVERAEGKGEKQKFKTINHPYLTDAGRISSGSRLEGFLGDVGSYEDPYYQNKRDSAEEENKRMRRADERAGRETLIPSQEVLDQVELAGRELYHEMLLKSSRTDDGASVSEDELRLEDEGDFKPVTSRAVPDAGLIQKLGSNLRGSLSPDDGGVAKMSPKTNTTAGESSLQDLKGRYYYDKFSFTPFDAEKHLALRKAYITGLVWNLEYYYRGVVSWEWYYPYNYGPMLSDLVNINAMLSEVSFFGEKDAKTPAPNEADGIRPIAGEPLRPFEQLLGCLPPSSSYLLPEPYRWLMTSPDSPLIDFYPDSFTVDMNGKRWPWEAVTLLPFIDGKKLINASRSLIDEGLLTEEETQLNKFGETHVLSKAIEGDNAVEVEPLNGSVWAKVKNDSNVSFQPELNHGTQIPGSCFPTLTDAPVRNLNRRKVFLNVFGLRSRYRTALLEMDDSLPPFPPTALLAQKFIGTTVNFRYPILYEGFVCSVADATTVYRGNERPQYYPEEDRKNRPAMIDKMFKDLEIGEGMTGTGGWVLPRSDITLTVRPLEALKTLPDGTKVKVYAKNEVEIPFVAALFSPSRRDPRLDIPAKLEKNPFCVGAQSRLDALELPASLELMIDEKLDILREKQPQDDGGMQISAGELGSSARDPHLAPKNDTDSLEVAKNVEEERPEEPKLTSHKLQSVDDLSRPASLELMIDEKLDILREKQPQDDGGMQISAGESGSSARDKVALLHVAPKNLEEERPEEPKLPSRELQSVDDLSRLTVPVLKDRLRQLGLPVSGRKAELIERIQVGSSRSFSTKSLWEAKGLRAPTHARPANRSFYSTANMARRGNPRQRLIGAAGAFAMSAFFFAT